MKNRRAFRERLEATLLKTKEEENEVFLGLMGLDGLKKVNDVYGHREGDRYISTFSSLLRRVLRPTEIAERIGGDEFAVIFTQCSRQYAQQTIRQLQQQLKEASLSLNFIMRVSAGLIAIESWIETDIDTLLSIADEAMYKQEYRHYRQVRAVIRERDYKGFCGKMAHF
ncbi:GGDEF domain-containing protein [Propionispora hippei]|uniref:GGDEF domain-containing protein n=1 Tax=Propionispora hippei TaxID=209080 RepID=UPI00122C9AF9|nr:GGDEF domain-containing protein [Propionispora hippei]